MSNVAPKPPPAADPYETDFYGWARRQSCALATRERHALDILNLIDEVDTLGRSQRRAIGSHLEVLIAHLFKFRCQPERASPSWRRTLRNQRREIAKLLVRSPSLASYPHDILVGSYEAAVDLACDETKIEKRRFPVTCPFTLEQILDPRFVPVPE